MKIEFKKDKDILMIVWQDAAFSNKTKLPQKMPLKQVTFGVFLGETSKAIKIGMNCQLENRKITECRDFFLIPKKVISSIKKISEIKI